MCNTGASCFQTLLACKKDEREEALEYDEHALGVYKADEIVGHVPV